MQISVITGNISAVSSGALIVAIFEDTKLANAELAAVDKALDGAVSRLIEQGEIKGKAKETTLIHTLGKLPAPRVLVLGLGKQPDISTGKVRGAMAEACRSLRQKNVDTIASLPHGAGLNNITAESAAQAVVEGAILGLYSFRTHISKKDDDRKEIKQLQIVGGADIQRQLEAGAAREQALAEATNLARDIVNEPANFVTPSHMAALANDLAQKHGLQVKVLEREQMTELKMGALLGVAQGSRQPPKFIILTYKGSDSSGIDVALVGKGITFDSGGISLKPSEGMGAMKGDKAGGVAVLAAISAIARLKPRINVTAFVPATENMPGGSAMRPGDILTAMSGQTIEIISTDAEGRLILADALAYARKDGARCLIDVATLTGACRTALGDVCTGLFSNNQELAEKVIAAGKETGELMWQMPMYDDYKEQLKSDVADMKNVGTGGGGAITAAKFLAEFAGSVPWVHLDIAATSQTDKERAHLVKGATGITVRTLVNVVMGMAAEKKGK